MPRVSLRPACLLLLLLWTTPARAQVTVELGPEETVFDWDTDRCETWDIPDMGARPFVDAAGKVQMIVGHYDLYRSIGDNLDDVARSCAKLVMVSHKNAIPRQYNDFEWLGSPYTLDGKTVYGLVHNEYHGWEHANCNASDNMNCWWNAITLVISKDSGASYPHTPPLLPPNHVVASSPQDYNPNNTDGPVGYFGGTNIIRKGAHYYTLLMMTAKGQQDWGVCAVRTTDLGDPKAYKGFDGSGFSVVLDKGICPVISKTNIGKMCSHLSYNTYLGKYLLAGPRGSQTDFHYATSGSLTSWPKFEVLMKTDLWWTTGATKKRAYPALIQPGDPTRNFERTGRSPYLYYTYWDTALGTANRDLRRRRVRFSLPGESKLYDVLSLEMNEYRGGKTLDSSFYSNTGLLEGGAAWSSERATGPRAISLPGTGAGRVRVPHAGSLSLSGSLTLEAFFKIGTPSASAWQVLVAKDGGKTARNYGLYVAHKGASTPGVLHFSFSSQTAYSGSLGTRRVDDGKWHHASVTYSAADKTARYYVDGLLDVARVHGKALGDGIGGAAVVIGADLKGKIDSVRIYNHARSAAQIKKDARGSGNVELCNGLDDDGDKAADEGFACPRGKTEQQPCTSGGQQSRTCRVDCTWGGWSPCPASPDAAPGFPDLSSRDGRSADAADASVVDADAGAPPHSIGGCGCRLLSAAPQGAPKGLWVFLFLLVLMRRFCAT